MAPYKVFVKEGDSEFDAGSAWLGRHPMNLGHSVRISCISAANLSFRHKEQGRSSRFETGFGVPIPFTNTIRI